MKKHLANIVSGSRIVAGVGLFFFQSLSPAFLTIYIFCGFTDLIDGPIARKCGSTGVLGATLDTVGDIITYLALAKILILQKAVPLWVILWMLGTAVGFAASGVIAKIRQGRFFLVHSLFGKVLGVVVFVMPIAMAIHATVGLVWMGVICTVSTIAAVESIVIQLKSSTVKTDAGLLTKEELS